MGFIWFWLVAIMLVGYVVLDGFDLGVGVLHLLLTRNDAERQMTIRAIGPVWDGNEVWLLAAGGTLYFAFPLLYASAFSGFYLPLMIVLWLLILRGVSVELRGHLTLNVWRSFFDGLFSFSSALLIIFYGAALANVIRGVPLGSDSYFFLPLWTNWKVGPNPGILDWYTVIGGLVALVALTLHGALYLAVKTEGALQQRARAIVRPLWAALVLLTIISLIATVAVRPGSLHNYYAYPIAFAIPVLVVACLAGILSFSRVGRDFTAFLCSAGYLVFMMVGAVSGLYPTLMPSSTDSNLNITIDKALSGPHTLHVGLVWWAFGMALAIGYFVFIYRMFRGKVDVSSTGYGH
ncbi:MAG TPA: cytochrome d ubiquinol oxidase subunit II [Acidisarcina sp.]|nr:cytochrome d ubiquinol oxidase subunit II [Acidisarcina sp.]